MGSRWRLWLAVVAFVGWLGYLGLAVVSKPQEAHLSAAAFAAARVRVIAELDTPPSQNPPTIRGQRYPDAQPFEGEVVNLSAVSGYAGPGRYLLLLEPVWGSYRIVGPPPSPGYHHFPPDTLRIYPWTEEIQAQAARLLPR